VSQAAASFFLTWLLEQLRGGKDVFGMPGIKIAEAYAKAWLDGWRPTL
jgi:hypothetical protein